MDERRFNEAEVAAIFERAAEAQQIQQQQIPSGEGMTLTELQDIGREVGFSREELAKAAQAIELRGRATTQRILGLPIGVGYTVDLARKLSDEEWERLVVDLRETFDARGVVRAEGTLRSWSNGNLQVFLEPTETGHRIRMRTSKGDARTILPMGLVTFGYGMLQLLASLGHPKEVLRFAVLAAVGAAIFAFGAIRLPGWASLRRRQMEGIASRAAAIASSSSQTEKS